MRLVEFGPLAQVRAMRLDTSQYSPTPASSEAPSAISSPVLCGKKRPVIYVMQPGLSKDISSSLPDARVEPTVVQAAWVGLCAIASWAWTGLASSWAWLCRLFGADKNAAETPPPVLASVPTPSVAATLLGTGAPVSKTSLAQTPAQRESYGPRPLAFTSEANSPRLQPYPKGAEVEDLGDITTRPIKRKHGLLVAMPAAASIQPRLVFCDIDTSMPAQKRRRLDDHSTQQQLVDFLRKRLSDKDARIDELQKARDDAAHKQVNSAKKEKFANRRISTLEEKIKFLQNELDIARESFDEEIKRAEQQQKELKAAIGQKNNAIKEKQKRLEAAKNKAEHMSAQHAAELEGLAKPVFVARSYSAPAVTHGPGSVTYEAQGESSEETLKFARPKPPRPRSSRARAASH